MGDRAAVYGSLRTEEIKIGNYYRDCLSQQTFLECMMHLKLSVREGKAGYVFQKGQQNYPTYLLFVDELKLYAKDEYHLSSLDGTVYSFNALYKS